MFERYTESARRTLFFARYEASQHGSASIEPVHLLLGLTRQGGGLIQRIFADVSLPLDEFRERVARTLPYRPKISTTVEIPFSAETRRVLAYAAEEAMLLGHGQIGPEHHLLGILREASGLAAAPLVRHGVTIDAVTRAIGQDGDERLPAPASAPVPVIAIATNASEIMIGDAGGRHVRIRLLRRSHPHATDYSDGNWIVSQVAVAVQGFTAAFGADLRAEDVHAFLRDVLTLEQSLKGEARFETTEEQLAIVLTSSSRGSVEVAGRCADHPGSRNVLSFRFEIDQTYLSPLCRAVADCVERFPIVGGPDA